MGTDQLRDVKRQITKAENGALIVHYPLFDTEKACELYSEKDGVDIKYVCTSAIGSEASAGDIFYRDTPHPEFKNHYFQLFYVYPDIENFSIRQLMIRGADAIEEADFTMLEGPDGWEYSAHRHDYHQVGDCAIDGGRAYDHRVGNIQSPTKTFKVVTGSFVET